MNPPNNPSDDPRPCCILGVCCPGAPKHSMRVTALAGYLADKGIENAADVAALVMEEFDLVPRGLVYAIVEAYEPYFAKKYQRSHEE